MGHVAHLVALADADQVAEIVGDDAQVIAMVADVGGQEGPVAPAEDPLLALVRGAPIHFHLQLVGLHQARRLAQPFLADLREKEHQPVGARPVPAEARVGLRFAAALDAGIREGERVRRIPLLGRERRGGRHEQDQPEREGRRH